MDEDEERMPGFRLEPLAGRTQHGLCGPLDLRRLLSRIRAEVKRAVVDVESPVQTEAGVQHIAADEGSGAVATRLEHRRERDDAGRDLLAVFFHAVNKRVGGTEQRRMGGQGHGHRAVHLAEERSSVRQPVHVRSANLASTRSSQGGLRAAYRRISERRTRRPGCQRETREGPEDTSEEPPHEPRRSRHQNWNRKAKLMTRELEDPLR